MEKHHKVDLHLTSKQKISFMQSKIQSEYQLLFRVHRKRTKIYRSDKGRNLYRYTEHFYQELRKINSTNGGCSIGMSSGLLSQTDFENGYRFITADLSRKPSEAVDNIAKSIQCIGTNSGLYPIDIFWFVFYEREIEIDIQTGSLIA